MGPSPNESPGMTPTSPRDRRSFDKALREGLPAVLDVMRLRGVPRSDRKDVAQKALIRAFKSIDGYDPARPFLPWLKTIAHRSAADHLRHLRARRQVEEVSADGAPEAADARAPNEEQMIRRHDAPMLLDQVLGHLTDERREVFVMAEMDELPLEEIARITETNANTVRSRLARAREDFEAALKRRWIAEEARTGAGVSLPPFFFSAAALIEAGRSTVFGPDLLARVWSDVARAIGSSVPPARPGRDGRDPSAPPPAPRPSTSASPLRTVRDGAPTGVAWLGGGASLKAALAASAAVFGAVVGGGVLWLRATSPEPAPSIAQEPPHPSELPATPAATTASPPGPPGSVVVVAPSASVSAAPRTDPAVYERQEAALLDKAHGLFTAGKTKEGCDVLRTMAQRFPRGMYQEQRGVLWSAAKCGDVKGR